MFKKKPPARIQPVIVQFLPCLIVGYLFIFACTQPQYQHTALWRSVLDTALKQADTASVHTLESTIRSLTNPLEQDSFAVQGKLGASIAERYQAITALAAFLQTPDLGPEQKKQAEFELFESKAFLANNFIQKVEYDKALEAVSPALDYFTNVSDTTRMVYCLTIHAFLLEKKGNITQAFAACRQSQAMLRATHNHAQLAENLDNYGKLLQVQEKWQEALDTFQVSYTLYEKINKKQNLHNADYNISRSLLHLNRLDEAEQKLNHVYEACQKNLQYSLALSVCQELVELYKRRGNFAMSLHFQEKAFAFRDSVFSLEKEKNTLDFAFKYETQAKEAQIKLLNKEKQLAAQHNAWIIGLLILLGALLVGLIWFRNRKQRDLQEKQLATARFENEALAAREALQIEKIAYSERELAKQQQQLDDFALLLLEKKQQIAAMMNKSSNTGGFLKIGSQFPDPAFTAAANEGDLEILLRHSLFSDSDYEVFKIYFECVYPNLIGKIKVTYPEVTDTETRVLLLIKMGLRDRQMGTMLGIAAESVKKMRYRLRQKTGVNEVELLEQIRY